MEYPIEMNGKAIGSARVTHEGLYTVICCDCGDLAEAFHRVHMEFEDKTVPLGLLVREGQRYVSCKRLPSKLLGKGEPVFYAVSDAGQEIKEKIPLIPGKPFPDLGSIRHGTLLIERDRRYLAL